MLPTDSKRGNVFIIRGLFTIGLTFYTPHYQINRKA
jgi:hypothetical protein